MISRTLVWNSSSSFPTPQAPSPFWAPAVASGTSVNSSTKRYKTQLLNTSNLSVVTPSAQRKSNMGGGVKNNTYLGGPPCCNDKFDPHSSWFLIFHQEMALQRTSSVVHIWNLPLQPNFLQPSDQYEPFKLAPQGGIFGCCRVCGTLTMCTYKNEFISTKSSNYGNHVIPNSSMGSLSPRSLLSTAASSWGLEMEPEGGGGRGGGDFFDFCSAALADFVRLRMLKRFFLLCIIDTAFKWISEQFAVQCSAHYNLLLRCIRTSIRFWNIVPLRLHDLRPTFSEWL